MSDTPPGTAPLETEGESAEVLKAKLVIAEKERDDAKAGELRANRAVEAGKKFEKFEDFQNATLGDIGTLKSDIANIKKENEELKTIISQKAAVTPNYNTVPQTPEEIQKASDEEKRTRSILGLPNK